MSFLEAGQWTGEAAPPRRKIPSRRAFNNRKGRSDLRSWLQIHLHKRWQGDFSPLSEVECPQRWQRHVNERRAVAGAGAGALHTQKKIQHRFKVIAFDFGINPIRFNQL